MFLRTTMRRKRKRKRRAMRIRTRIWGTDCSEAS
jgi:hypothetical protein